MMHINGENAPSSVAGATEDVLLNKQTAFESRVALKRAVVVGLYGVPGSGKRSTIPEQRRSVSPYLRIKEVMKSS